MSSSAPTIALFAPLLVGLAASIFSVGFHALAGRTIIELVRVEIRRGLAGQELWRDVTINSAVGLLLLTAHFTEIALWATIFVLCHEFADFPQAFYHAAVNYTTLGYGDLVMSPPWRLLGPIEAATGMLLFGLSTAILLSVIQELVQTRLHAPDWWNDKAASALRSESSAVA